ncbi:TPA: hypothetical protein DDW35_08585 [Candidatus Sumerlaeota bacterium]|jgi:glycosyltransferase involved in cell wall biosynthesis|nr:hypothetical protein [Candidatus Sumerlaeota bacterium]
MRVLVDASVLHQPSAGMAKVLTGLYRACVALEPTLDVRLLHRVPLQTAVPPGTHAVRRGSFLRPGPWHEWMVPLAALGADVVHFPANGNIPRLWKRKPVVMTLHDVLPLMIPNFFANEKLRAHYTALVQRDLDRTDLLMTDSIFSREQILRHFKTRNEPHVVYPAVDLEEVTRDSASSEMVIYEGYFVYVGGYHARKGLPELLKVFSELRRENKISARLILAGSSYPISPEFDRLLAEGKLAGWVEERGYVNETELGQLYRGALALIYPSRYEGFGLPPLEAMTMECPVLTTGQTSLREVCGEAALYADPSDAAFAESIIALEKQPILRRDLRMRGLGQSEKFTWNKSAHRYLELLHGMVKPKR